VINDLGLYNSAFNNNSTVAHKSHDEIQALTERYNGKIVKSEGAANTVDNLFLSSKAQKINAISSEFFSGAELTFDDIDKLKEKLYQFGLISKNDYASLSSNIVDDSISANNEDISTTTLNSFIGDFLERLNKEDGNENAEGGDKVNKSESIVALTKVLNVAKDIFANVEEQKNKGDFKSSLQNSLALLKETISDKSFSGLPLDDQIGLSKVYQGLEIVDNLSPQRLSNDKVNKYIDLSFS
jgi:hypothetical protein